MISVAQMEKHLAKQRAPDKLMFGRKVTVPKKQPSTMKQRHAANAAGKHLIKKVENITPMKSKPDITPLKK